MPLFIVLYGLLSGVTFADTRCHFIARPSLEEKSVTEKWCYEYLTDGRRLIFNADGEVRPELSVLVESDGSLTHGSLRSGEQSTHRVSGFNPLGVPLVEPSVPSAVARPSSLESAAAREVLKDFLKRAIGIASVGTIRAGDTYGVADYQPWVGTSWAFRHKEMYTGVDAPLAKFDRLVERRTGANPGVLAWETREHADDHWWGGHCNGWAVSAILRPEPTRPVFDSQTGVTFKVSALKGLLAAKDFCAKIAMFGNRNDATEADRTDIDPVDFHNALTYYVGELRKPLAFEYRPDEVVDTHVVSAYRLRVKDLGGGKARVHAKVTIHGYDKLASEKLGPAKIYFRDYIYDVVTDSNGTLLSGTWVSDNPDFVYAPLSASYCPTRHPGLTEEWLQFILNLPPVR